MLGRPWINFRVEYEGKSPSLSFSDSTTEEGLAGPESVGPSCRGMRYLGPVIYTRGSMINF